MPNDSWNETHWLKAIDELKAIAQAGRTYSTNQYDLERYVQINDVAASMLENISTLPKDEIVNIFSKDKGYNTPKLDVRAGVFNGEKILLVKEESDNKWSLPGGWTDVNESPSEAAVREVLEETGLTVCVSKFVALHDKQKHAHPPQLPHAYKMFFLCDVMFGELKTSHETISVGWFELDALPELSEDRVVISQIKMLYEHKNNENLHAEYD